MALEHQELTSQIIGAAVRVHKALGPGFIESIYENALCIELARMGIRFQRQLIVKVYFEEHEVGEHRLDLFVEDLIVVELKAIREFEERHFSITRSYIKAMNRKHGLLLNFGCTRLKVKRVIYDPTHPDGVAS